MQAQGAPFSFMYFYAYDLETHRPHLFSPSSTLLYSPLLSSPLLSSPLLSSPLLYSPLIHILLSLSSPLLSSPLLSSHYPQLYSLLLTLISHSHTSHTLTPPPPSSPATASNDVSLSLFSPRGKKSKKAF